MLIPDAGQNITFIDANNVEKTGTVISSSSIRWTEQTETGPQERQQHIATVDIDGGGTVTITESTVWSAV